VQECLKKPSFCSRKAQWRERKEDTRMSASIVEKKAGEGKHEKTIEGMKNYRS
jgi:hypothetical protein